VVGFTNDLASGVAQLLEDEGIAAWSPTGTYGAGVLGIFLEAVPETADRLITLTPYPVSETVTGESIVGMQVRTRLPGQDPRPIEDLDDQIMAAINGRAFTVNGIKVTLCQWQSGASLGVDASKRRNRSSNYYLRTVRPSSYRY
jgi:hypothetical protein